MKILFFKLFRIIAGVALLLLGVVGLFLPVLQGILFLALGLLLLSIDIPWFRRFAEALEKKHPRLESFLKKWRQRLEGETSA